MAAEKFDPMLVPKLGKWVTGLTSLNEPITGELVYRHLEFNQAKIEEEPDAVPVDVQLSTVRLAEEATYRAPIDVTIPSTVDVVPPAIESDVDVLHEAAELLERAAGKASPAPWFFEQGDDINGEIHNIHNERSVHVSPIAAGVHPDDAPWICLMGPDLAHAQARIFREEARRRYNDPSSTSEHVLSYARRLVQGRVLDV